ncbi:ABC transporter permease subunit [Clostridium oceanicum]|uniref:ABC transporter permease n=1 Tax=Clostridium oceanicum TaxID=1543 RepID=A0ABP3UJN6_9CLOT
MENLKGFFKLVANENMKSFFRLRTLIFAIFFIVSIGIMGYFHSTHAPNINKDNWKTSAKNEIQKLKEENTKLQSDISNTKSTNTKSSAIIELNKNNDKIKKLNYSIKHNIPTNMRTPWDFTNKNMEAFLGPLIYFVLMYGVGTIYLENKNNTMKQLLIRPHSRYKILLSKITSTILFTAIASLFVMLILLITGVILYGKNGMGQNILTLIDGKIVENNAYIFHIKYLMYGLIRYTLSISVGFMMALIFNSQIIAILTALFITNSGATLVPFIAKYSWAKYVLFSNLDLAGKLSVTSSFPHVEGVTVPFSISIVLIYSLVFFAISFVYFKKKNIA